MAMFVLDGHLIDDENNNLNNEKSEFNKLSKNIWAKDLMA